jgi:glycosyltransferase involved in cell wall biosynthesis
LKVLKHPEHANRPPVAENHYFYRTMQPISASVVMPVYNREKYLEEAINSILNQTFQDFEFIIVNDASTDRSEEIILSYKDPRIRYFKNDVQSGTAATRNRGMKESAGKYIAVMDSDDISLPFRLKLQYEFLEKHPDIGILSGANIFFKETEWFIKHFPSDPDFIRSCLFFKNPVAQPSVIFRATMVHEMGLYYNPEYLVAEDFDLWYRAVMKGVKIRNLKRPLLLYRMSEHQLMGPEFDALRIRLEAKILMEKLLMLGVVIPEKDFNILHAFLRGRIDIGQNEYVIINDYLNRIDEANTLKNIFSTLTFRAILLTYRIRLIKYYYLEKNRPIAFGKALLKMINRFGPGVFLCFWKNEGRFFVNKKIFQGKPTEISLQE